jgi:hypothetical protein
MMGQDYVGIKKTDAELEATLKTLIPRQIYRLPVLVLDC